MSHPYICIISDYAPTFREATQGLTYIRRGVFWSELLAFAAMAKHAGAQRVVESGTGLGFSCRVLARLFPSVVTIGLEDKPADLPDNVTFVPGDAWEELHKWADDTCAVLIDGPKHEEAVTLAQETDFAAVIGVHDCALGMPARPLLKQAFPGMFFTDDVDYAETFMSMDAECFAMAEKNGKRFPTYGPTIGIIVL